RRPLTRQGLGRPGLREARIRTAGHHARRHLGAGGRSVRACHMSTRLGAAVLVAALGLGGAGCSNVGNLSFRTPPTTVHVDLGAGATLPTNLSAVNQPGVEGVTTTTAPPVGPGQATINGTVFGPSGPVPGATVEVDRFVGDQFSSAHTTTAADGTW